MEAPPQDTPPARQQRARTAASLARLLGRAIEGAACGVGLSGWGAQVSHTIWV
jgi:hypothetical protein